MFVTRDQVPLSWHEAVAVVRSVADALEDGRIGSVPEPGQLAIEWDGSLQVPPSARDTFADATRQTSGLRELLLALLPADAPAELRALAEGQDVGGAGDALIGFRQALAYFERPSYQDDLRVLGARLLETGEERKLKDEIERLSRKTRTEAPVKEDRREPTTLPSRKSFRKPLLALVFLGVVAVAAVVVIGFAPVSVGSSGSAVAAGHREAGKKGIVERLRDAATSAFKKAPPPQPAAVEKTAQPAPAIQRRKPPRRSPVATSTPPSQPHSFKALGGMQNELVMLPVRITSWSPPELKLARDSTLIHDRSDPDVIPPMLLRPHLPTVGSVGLSGTQLGAVEVVVAGDGRVDLVRLIRTTAERRYYDVMILAAVKAWVFRPATRDGQPVRYRVQIPLS